MKHLFEYGESQPIEDRASLTLLLRQLWQSRLFTHMLDESAIGECEQKQPFLQFDGNSVRANNFVGFIQHRDLLIEIYPKVFRADNCQDKEIMLKHIFFWFDYCRKWKLPFSQAGLQTQLIDSFPELIIHLMAHQIRETIYAQPYFTYAPMEEALMNPRGHVNFKRYIQNSLGRAKDHYIECDHYPFVFDNKVNRVIKYAVRLLSQQAKYSQNTRLLESSLHLLDEVQDIPCHEQDIDSITLNSYYQTYEAVLLTCRMIISQQLYSSEYYDLPQWALLFPMEYLFEDFIAGFLEEKFSAAWKVEYQKSDAYLSDVPKVFNIQHDIYLSGKGRKIIIDTKYKVRDKQFKDDPKKGVSHADLYQVVSYAVKRGCHEVYLLYPNIGKALAEPDVFTIRTGFEIMETITVTAMEVPFWSRENFNGIESRLRDVLETNLKL